MSDHGRAHALLSPSSAERWISCPASVRVIASLERTDDGGSMWAEEGTRCHTLGYLEASRAFGLLSEEDYLAHKAAWLRSAEDHGDDVEEMERHVRAYVSLLQDIMADIPHAKIHLEKRVDSGVPGAWGTADAIIVGVTIVVIVDFKYGQGVVVRAEDNPQLMLYGLGALEGYGDVLGTTEDVHMWIHQPRTGNTSRFAMSAKELRDWRDSVALPSARETQHPDARFGPSEQACRWCPAAGICKPRAVHITQRDFGNPDLMTADELAAAVLRIGEIRDWCNAVEAEGLHQAYSEQKPLPGLKVVLSGGRRSISDTEQAISALVSAGFPEEQVTRKTLKTLGDLERLVTKKRLPEILGSLLVKGKGSPALVPEDDPRPVVDALVEAQKDFQTPSSG